ncbi:hypothetical protein [Streptomyces sp. NPDC001507]|uniref:hypothetical protein n=1 Tax=Streptomyces sp. NPDC001507 TaxID=3364579 RepID=UPI00369E2AA1
MTEIVCVSGSLWWASAYSAVVATLRRTVSERFGGAGTCVEGEFAHPQVVTALESFLLTVLAAARRQEPSAADGRPRRTFPDAGK